jgi:aryl carrier-like protein
MTTVTHDDFLAAGPDERVRLVEDLIVTSLLALRPGQPAWFDGATHLADLAIDSIQLVELKFALDQLVGVELDVSVFIANPTVHELAQNIAAIGK